MMGMPIRLSMFELRSLGTVVPLTRMHDTQQLRSRTKSSGAQANTRRGTDRLSSGLTATHHVRPYSLSA